jgi:hypothetical protein
MSALLRDPYGVAVAVPTGYDRTAGARPAATLPTRSTPSSVSPDSPLAIASLIQEDIGANPEQQPGTGPGTFSFDVRNGGCGMLSGIQLVDGLLASKTVKLGMVVPPTSTRSRASPKGSPSPGSAVRCC